jgi:putative transposase
MARPTRSVIPGIPYHIVQRAAHKGFILDCNDDLAVFMSMLLEWQEETNMQIGGFVLMGNHFHLAGISPTEGALPKFMGNVCSEFSRFRNSKLGQRGPNWQGRYFAAPMDMDYTLSAIRYIERNPVAAGMVPDAWQWKWSSAAFHAGLGPKPELLNINLVSPPMSPSQWKQGLLSESTPEFRSRLREATCLGRPLGSKEWTARIESELGLSPLRKRGRPRK